MGFFKNVVFVVILAGVLSFLLTRGGLMTNMKPILHKLADVPQSYDLVTLTTPKLSGTLLSIVSKVIATPVVGPLITRLLLNQNQAHELRVLAASNSAEFFYWPIQTLTPQEYRIHEQLAAKSANLLTDFKTDCEHVRTSFQDKDGFRYWTIEDYATHYRCGKTKPSEVTKKIIDLARNDPQLKRLSLITQIHEEEVLKAAYASDARFAQGQPLGILDGIPFAVKGTCV